MPTHSGSRLAAFATALALTALGLVSAAPAASATDCVRVVVTSEDFTIATPVTAGTAYCLDFSGFPAAAAFAEAVDFGWSDNVSNGLVDISSGFDRTSRVLTWTPLGRPAKSSSRLTVDTSSTLFTVRYSWAAPTLAGQPATEIFRTDGNEAYPDSRPSQDGGWWNDAIITMGTLPRSSRAGRVVTVPLQVVCSNPGYDAGTGTSNMVVKLWDLGPDRFLWPADVARNDVPWTFGELGDSESGTTVGSWAQTGSFWTWSGSMTFTVPDIGWHNLAMWSYGAACNGGGIYTNLGGMDVVDPHGVADTADAYSGRPVDIDVLANDPEGSALSEITAQPTNGTATIVDGKVRYTPQRGFTGTDVLRYSLDGVSGDVAVTVSVSTPPPGSPVDLTVDGTTATTIDLSWTAPEELGSGLDTYVVSVSPAGEDSFEVLARTDADHATVDGLEPGTDYDIQVVTQATDAQTSDPAGTEATTGPGAIAPVASSRTVITGGTGRVTIQGVSPSAVVTLGPLAEGLRSATVDGTAVTVRTIRGFSGLVAQPVTVTDGGATASLHLRVLVRPTSPTSRVFTPAVGGGTTVTWKRSPGTTAYVVTAGGKTLCRTASRATSCRTTKLLGPATTVKIRAAGHDGTSSPSKRADYRAPQRPVVVSSIGFGTSGLDLTPSMRADIVALAKKLAAQGLTRLEVRGHAASTGTDPASRAAQERASRLRATAVGEALRAALTAAGSTATVRITWAGASDPVADNLAFDGRIANRRADVIIR